MGNAGRMSESRLVRVDGVPVVAEQWAGNGPPIVLLHAGVCDRRSWYRTVERLWDHGRVLAYDRRGFGDSPASAEPYRDPEDLLALLDHLGGDEPAWLVGTSMGGQVAVDAALMRPDRVGGLVLLAPAVSGAPEPEVLDADTQRLSDLIDAAASTGDMEEVNRLEAWLWLDGPASPEGRVVGAARNLVLAMNAVALSNNIDETADEADGDAWHRLEEIKVPVTVAWGELDVPFLIEQCQQLVERLPHAQGLMLPGVAHLPYLEDPELVATLICAALNRP